MSSTEEEIDVVNIKPKETSSARASSGISSPPRINPFGAVGERNFRPSTPTSRNAIAMVEEHAERVIRSMQAESVASGTNTAASHKTFEPHPGAISSTYVSTPIPIDFSLDTADQMHSRPAKTYAIAAMALQDVKNLVIRPYHVHNPQNFMQLNTVTTTAMRERNLIIRADSSLRKEHGGDFSLTTERQNLPSAFKTAEHTITSGLQDITLRTRQLHNEPVPSTSRAEDSAKDDHEKPLDLSTKPTILPARKRQQKRVKTNQPSEKDRRTNEELQPAGLSSNAEHIIVPMKSGRPARNLGANRCRYDMPTVQHASHNCTIVVPFDNCHSYGNVSLSHPLELDQNHLILESEEDKGACICGKPYMAPALK
ncbi:hypothetical protein QAD02_002018 [Eretmocerus hayati]|uniref:Uncharacterized protein n=1 Tax=Eretmocerus hayati TaxID=131215 RepID=A0ACC2NKB4_9HYME|nr:hypothetical protein QAD02_002018 [Eretmocerus hayati]